MYSVNEVCRGAGLRNHREWRRASDVYGPSSGTKRTPRRT